MTRKDYVAFAEMFEKLPRHSAIDPYDVWYLAVQGAADIFQRDNPAFDKRRFLDACGVVVTS